MPRLDQESEVIELARLLGLSRQENAVEGVVGYCLARVSGWLEDYGPVATAAELECLAAQRLGLVFEEIWSDEDLDALVAKYVAKGEGVFAILKSDLDEGTFGVTIRRRRASTNALDRYVAVIDCRGDKGARRFFTRWHEIAHLLVATEDLKAPVRRAAHDPIERLMDEIAARAGFYEPLFGPAFDAEMGGQRRLSFERVEAVRQRFHSGASLQSTLFACLRRHGRPVVYVEAALALKADEAREVKNGGRRLFGDDPEPKLRAVTVVPNEAAQRDKLFIAPNMRVPESSVIHRLFRDDQAQGAAAEENLHGWEHSGGKRLRPRDVWVEARMALGRVTAIVQPR